MTAKAIEAIKALIAQAEQAAGEAQRKMEKHQAEAFALRNALHEVEKYKEPKPLLGGAGAHADDVAYVKEVNAAVRDFPFVPCVSCRSGCDAESGCMAKKGPLPPERHPCGCHVEDHLPGACRKTRVMPIGPGRALVCPVDGSACTDPKCSDRPNGCQRG